jgi:pilus assembly protein CpaE
MRVVITQESDGPPETLRKTLLEMGLDCSLGDCVPFSQLPVRLARNAVDLVLVRVGADASAARDALKQALTLTRAPLVAVGPADDGRRILDMLQSGAREYLDQDRVQETLEAALDKLRAAGAVHSGPGRVVGVLSSTPGSGVTTVATNLAFVWAAKYRDRVSLAELGREDAALALNLDLSPRFTPAEAAAGWERMDAAYLRQGMTPHPDGVQVLAHKAETAPAALEPLAVRKTLLLLRAMYAASVIDLGHLLGEEQQEALRLCDRLVVVVRLDVPALRQSRRLLRELADRGVPRERIVPVANRYGQRGQLPWKKAEEALGVPFAAYLPDDSSGTNYALNQGQPLVRLSRYGSLSRRFAKLAQTLEG